MIFCLAAIKIIFILINLFLRNPAEDNVSNFLGTIYESKLISYEYNLVLV